MRMNDNFVVVSLVIWFTLLGIFTYGTPDLLDHLTGNPVEVECEHNPD
jgi:hypothetical protein